MTRSQKKLLLPLIGLVIVSAILLLPKDMLGLHDYWRTDNYVIHYSLVRVLTALLLITASLALLKKLSCPMSLSTLLPTNLFVYLCLFMIMPGLLLTSDFSSSGAISFYGYLLSFFLFAVGAAVSSIAFRFDPQKELDAFVSSRLYAHPPGTMTYDFFIILFVTSFVIACLTTGFDTSTFAEIYRFLVSGMSLDGSINQSRQASYYDTTGSLLTTLSNYCKVMFLPLSSVFVLATGLIRSDRRKTICGSLMIAATFVFLVSSGARRDALFILLFILVALSFIKPLRMRRLALFAAIGIVFLVAQTLILGRMTYADGAINNVVKSLNRSTERVFMTKGVCSQTVFQYIPEYADFKKGTTLIGSLLGQGNSQEPFAIEMYRFIYNDRLGTAGPQAFADAYANFGVTGMLISAFLIGIAVQSISVYVVRRHIRDANAAQLVFNAYLVILFAKIGYADIMTFKSSGFHILLILMCTFSAVASHKRYPSFPALSQSQCKF